MEISAPAGPNFGWQAVGCVTGIVSVFLLMGGALINPVVALLLSTLPVVWWGIGNRLNKDQQTTRIVLRIDQQDISLWEQSQSEQRRCFKKTARSTIHKLQFVYKKIDKNQLSCHIKISARDPSNGLKNSVFLVGNRSFWLPQREAEWLAHELGIWLKLPVTEVEVIENSA